MSETYTKDLITIGKNLYVVEPIQNDQERLKYLLNCANNTQTAIHSSLQELGTMMWMASNSNGTEGVGNEHEVLHGAGVLLEILGEVLEASKEVQGNCRYNLDKLKKGGAQ